MVVLRNGSICGEEPVANACPAGWPVDGKSGARWDLAGDPFDIIWFKPL